MEDRYIEFLTKILSLMARDHDKTKNQMIGFINIFAVRKTS